MPLPVVNDLVTPPNTSTLGDALLANPPVSAEENTVFKPRRGNAAWVGNKLTISGEGLVNYWYIPAVQDEVSYCVVHCNGAGDAYVISDQYGGCEYHELYNATFKQLAFLHVYRGGGKTAQYCHRPGLGAQKYQALGRHRPGRRDERQQLVGVVHRPEHQSADRREQVRSCGGLSEPQGHHGRQRRRSLCIGSWPERPSAARRKCPAVADRSLTLLTQARTPVLPRLLQPAGLVQSHPGTPDRVAEPATPDQQTAACSVPPDDAASNRRKTRSPNDPSPVSRRNSATCWMQSSGVPAIWMLT